MAAVTKSFDCRYCRDRRYYNINCQEGTLVRELTTVPPGITFKGIDKQGEEVKICPMALKMNAIAKDILYDPFEAMKYHKMTE